MRFNLMKIVMPSGIDFEDFNNLPTHDEITEIDSDNFSGWNVGIVLLEKFAMTNLQMPAENWIQMAKNCTKQLCFNCTAHWRDPRLFCSLTT